MTISNKKRNKRTILYWVIAIIIMVFSFEAVLQLLSLVAPSIDCRFFTSTSFGVHNDCVLFKDGKLGVRGNPSYPQHDHNGYRNKKVPDRADIVALGDSNTYGYFAKPEEAWPQQLGMLSNTITYNMGFGSYCPVHSLIQYEEAKSLDPKLIIVAFFAGNDVGDSYNIVYYKGQYPKLKSIDPNILKSIGQMKDKTRVRGKITRKIKRKSFVNLEDWKRNIKNKSKLYGLYKTSKKLFKSVVKYVLQSMHISLDFWESRKWNSIKQRVEKDKNSQIFENDKFKTVFNINTGPWALNLEAPKIQEGLRISLQALKELNNRSVHDGIMLIALLIPTKELAFRDIVQQDFTNKIRNYQDLVDNEEIIWRKTKNFLRSHQIDFVDALPTMRESLKKGDEPYMQYDPHGHVSVKGQQAIAKLLNTYFNTYKVLSK